TAHAPNHDNADDGRTCSRNDDVVGRFPRSTETMAASSFFSDAGVALTGRRSSPQCPKSPGQVLLAELLTSGLILSEEWEAVGPRTRTELTAADDSRDLLALLREHELLTAYQATRLESG